MPAIKLFFDSSALVSGVISPTGGARALLVLAEAGQFTLLVSEQVIAETERALARKAPQALPLYREALRQARIRVVHDPAADEIAAHAGIIAHAADVPIVVAAMKAQADYLVTLNRRHFLDDAAVSRRAGLPMGTPGDALRWLRGRLSQERE